MPRLWLYCYIWGPQHWGQLGVGLELTKAWDDQNVSFSGVHVVCMYLYVEARRQLPCPQLLYTWFLRQILHWSGIHQIGYASCPLSARELPPLPPEHLGYHSMLPFFTQALGMELRSSCLQGLGLANRYCQQQSQQQQNKQKSNPHSNFWVLFILKLKPILLSRIFYVCSYYLRINCCILWLSS